MKNLKVKASILGGIVAVIVAAIYYYIVLPPINIHAPGFWKFIIIIALVLTVAAFITNASLVDKFVEKGNASYNSKKIVYKTTRGKFLCKGLVIASLLVVVIYIGGSLLSSKIFNAAKYQQLLDVETRNFKEDIHEVSYDQIPILDKDSAVVLGNRVMGTMVDMVSQFEVSDMYSQINYNNKPMRVSPLQYGSLIKWFTNKSEGIPGYIRIDMTTQQAEVVRLSEGMKYTKSEHFGRNVYRHLRFSYPTYIFDEINFEIDEDGIPYWICPVKKYNIGLFGGVTVGRVVICNAITGETKDYAIEDVPQWVDKAYSADMLIELYDYSGTLKHGFINSVFGQKDCLQTTDGYNYIALDDDVWVYTGITSVGQDQSNVGFVLMNQRTMETRYYEISGAEEYSAMSSAEGQVQHLGYKATFPILLNVGGQPTYFMALKDSAGLVKQYAMLNIEKYQAVATADSVLQCESNYRQLMSDSGIVDTKPVSTDSVTGVISKISQAVIDGNSHFYIMLEGNNEIYDVSVVTALDVIRCNVGDSINFEYTKGDTINTINAIKTITQK